MSASNPYETEAPPAASDRPVRGAPFRSPDGAVVVAEIVAPTGDSVLSIEIWPAKPPAKSSRVAIRKVIDGPKHQYVNMVLLSPLDVRSFQRAIGRTIRQLEGSGALLGPQSPADGRD